MNNRLANTIQSLQGRQLGITPSVDRFLLEHGDEQIREFIISRNVLSPMITGSIGIISPSAKRKNNGNPLYHLKVLIKTERTSLSLEKNERINISKYQMNQGAENMPVAIPSGLTLNSLLANTKQLMGNKFLAYSAYDNNCGHFVLAILRSNNLSTSQNVSFTEQTIKHLFTPQLRKISNTITNIAGKVDIIRQGGDIKSAKKHNPWIEHVRQFAKDNGINYFQALKDPKCKTSYRKVKGHGVGSSRISPAQEEEEQEEIRRARYENNNFYRDLRSVQEDEKELRDEVQYRKYMNLSNAQKKKQLPYIKGNVFYIQAEELREEAEEEADRLREEAEAIERFMREQEEIALQRRELQQRRQHFKATGQHLRINR
jgi:hypothetical protein